MDLKVKDKVSFINMQNGIKEIGEIQLIAEVKECCTTGIVGRYVYYVRTTTGGQLFFSKNLKKYIDKIGEQCTCMNEENLNSYIKCSRCGREL